MANQGTQITSVISCISSLKHKFGIDFDHIIDVGACLGNWTRKCLEIFPMSQYHLFEPIDYPLLNDFNAQNIQIYHTILNEFNGEVDWYEGKNTGDSIFRERTTHYQNVLSMRKPCSKLDDILHIDSGNILFKIDAQGAEIPILKGSTKILQRTDFILLELPFVGRYNEGVPSFAEHITFMDSIGFIVLDIVEVHYFDVFLIQVDIIFVSKNHPLHSVIDTSIKSL